MSTVIYTDTTITSPRVVILGDIGANRKPFYGRLREIGVRTSTNEIPGDLVIIQIGDLIGRAPDASAEIIRHVRALRHRNPGQWVQLIGNREARYHPYGARFAPSERRTHRDLDVAHQKILNGFWREPHTGVAAAISTRRMSPTLLTHAGVTREFLQAIGATNHINARKVAHDINFSLADPNLRQHVFALGQMYRGLEPGPLGASHGELWRSWHHHPLSFDQIVGHTNPYRFSKNRWNDANPIPETQWATPNPPRRMTYWKPSKSNFGIAHIDPGLWHGSTTDELPAHLFEDATVTISQPQPR